MHPTSSPEINELLARFLAELRALLGEQLAGCYLHGSLAGGDFNPQRSDIDFVVATTEPLAESTVAALRAMHERLGAVVSKPVTARWLQAWEPRWTPLVVEAVRWRNGLPMDRLDETLTLIRFTLQRCP
jgi:predicted nucleotidyltransferase